VVGSTPKAKVLPQRRAADVVNNETCSFMMEIPLVPAVVVFVMTKISEGNLLE
jgi:hypothetical protein